MYGIALQSFQIGFLYKKYAKELCSKEAKDLASENQKLFDTPEQCYKHANLSFRRAYENFKKINHLKGQSMSLLYEAKSERDVERKSSILRTANKL